MIRRLAHANGADRTGLGRLIELSATHSAGDALITVSLAGALLFQLPVGQARGQVALYLLITMVPFAVVAPFVGPVLDRFRSGRRYIMAGTLFARGLLCWGMAGAVHSSDALTLFPSALAILVLSKAYNVSRAAIMPSVLPADIALVSANARVSLFALVSAAAGAAVGTGVAALIGPEWVLRATMPLFLAAGVGAVRLPRHVDSPDVELEAEERPSRWRTILGVGPVVTEAVIANVVIRVQAGFLVFFLLFLVQDHHLHGLGPQASLTLLAVAAGGGGFAGAAAASWSRSRSPLLTVLATLAVTTVTTVATAFFFNLWTALVVALVGAFSQSLGKLALDAIVQREIGEEVRSSTFGVVETLLQLAWVFGGLLGLVMSLFAPGPTGIAVISAGLAFCFVWLLTLRRRRLAAVTPEPAS
ncbi:MFS transporter [Planotetraspora thailandica]|uniref:MFS transporter n=1 Tax=Planotetraspora thailandica TaxID=487172 RepID=A0A8J3Y0E1_9ACTN|nr:MFS transporter [Planotetraspora thailandica]